MTTLRIAEVAKRSGFSAPTLRYYETIGLLPPAERSDNGYRVYDQATLDRLAFIARAKQLGCSLDEIADLATAWDGGRCAPVQERLGQAVAARIKEAQNRTAAMTALVADLQRAAATLAAHTPDGPCDDRCGCTTDPVVSQPIACTLAAGDQGQRLDDWRDLLTQVTERTAVEGGIRLSFDPSAPVDRIARLVAAEQDCCRFFAFAITVDQRGVALEVRAPEDAQDVLASLFAYPRRHVGDSWESEGVHREHGGPGGHAADAGGRVRGDIG